MTIAGYKSQTWHSKSKIIAQLQLQIDKMQQQSELKELKKNLQAVD